MTPLDPWLRAKNLKQFKSFIYSSLDYAVIGFVSHDYDKAKTKLEKLDQNTRIKELRQALLYAIEEKRGLKHSLMVMVQ